MKASEEKEHVLPHTKELALEPASHAELLPRPTSHRWGEGGVGGVLLGTVRWSCEKDSFLQHVPRTSLFLGAEFQKLQLSVCPAYQLRTFPWNEVVCNLEQVI